ncbi:MAG TPA: HAD-IB family phosphatase [Steroidobacteraceae bacterium]|nr:HAD-IB family phosphatase [Steroidobacteraceae bacterium]
MSEARAAPSLPARLAVFDLDGTISRRGTLAPYVIRLLARRPWRWLRVVMVAPALLAYLLGRIDRGALKARLLEKTLRGYGRAALEAWTARFVPWLIERGLRGDALRAIEAHRRRGDRLVLLSASPDLYVPALGAQLGFEDTLCTELTWHGDNLDGGLATPNRRDKEKARCILELRQRYPGVPIAAYGNEAADLDHLAIVDEPLLVCGSAAARRQAARVGVPTARWR